MSSRISTRDRILGVCAIVLWIAALALATVGCSAIAPSLAERADAVVERYCRTPLEQRQVLSAVVNRELAPHRIEVTCAGDPASSPAPAADPVVVVGEASSA